MLQACMRPLRTALLAIMLVAVIALPAAAVPSTPVAGATIQTAFPADRVHWRNTTYTLNCAGVAPKPFKVQVRNGKGHGSPDSRYDMGYFIDVEAVAVGDLTGDDLPEAAVLLSCSPQPSNFFVQEVQIFTTGPRLLAKLPNLDPLPTGISLPPVFGSREFSIRDDKLVTGVWYYSANDSHVSGPSIHRVLTWRWDGRRFTPTTTSLLFQDLAA
jgi:hypothetical protein